MKRLYKLVSFGKYGYVIHYTVIEEEVVIFKGLSWKRESP